MPTTYRRRPAPCTHCGDVVLISEHTSNKLLGRPVAGPPTLGLEHADPSPEGEVYDDVDAGCRRQPVA